MLLILSDGKKGHENQSLGLAEALAKRTGLSYEIQPLSEQESPSARPSALIAAGHATQLPLLHLARKYKVPSILIMKPSLIPTVFFSRCLIPEHDLGKRLPPRVIATLGNLNRIPEELPEKKGLGLIMLGGPCKHFQWETPLVVEAICALVRSRPDLVWTLGDSRRTPPETLSRLRQCSLPLSIMSHQESGPDWLRDSLLVSREAWVTPDSSSMLYEALTAGCHLGTLPLRARGTRLSRAHDHLARDGWLTPFAEYHGNATLLIAQNLI
jgi:hypothetical protein